MKLPSLLVFVVLGFAPASFPAFAQPDLAVPNDAVQPAKVNTISVAIHPYPPSETGTGTVQPAKVNTIVQRAKVWVDRKIPYSQSKTAYPNGSLAPLTKGYRTDCSGFVSMAWHLPAKGLAVPNTVALSQYATTLTNKDQLQPGDAINNRKWGNSGHVVLFLKWTNKRRGKFIAYEERGSKGAIQSKLTLRRKGQAWTIQEFGTQHNPWYLERKK